MSELPCGSTEKMFKGMFQNSDSQQPKTRLFKSKKKMFSTLSQVLNSERCARSKMVSNQLRIVRNETKLVTEYVASTGGKYYRAQYPGKYGGVFQIGVQLQQDQMLNSSGDETKLMPDVARKVTKGRQGKYGGGLIHGVQQVPDQIHSRNHNSSLYHSPLNPSNTRHKSTSPTHTITRRTTNGTNINNAKRHNHISDPSYIFIYTRPQMQVTKEGVRQRINL